MQLIKDTNKRLMQQTKVKSRKKMTVITELQDRMTAGLQDRKTARPQDYIIPFEIAVLTSAAVFFELNLTSRFFRWLSTVELLMKSLSAIS